MFKIANTVYLISDQFRTKIADTFIMMKLRLTKFPPTKYEFD